jgi:hypothetical protein
LREDRLYYIYQNCLRGEAGNWLLAEVVQEERQKEMLCEEQDKVNIRAKEKVHEEESREKIEEQKAQSRAEHKAE